MSKQKIILLSLIAIFAVIYGIQLATSGANSVKTIVLDQDIDAIRVILADSSSYVLSKKISASSDGNSDNETEAVWMIDNGKKAENSVVSSMEAQLKEIKIVGNISSMTSADLYDLQDGKSVIVEALSGEDIVRTLRIGKLTDTSSQTYVEIDENNSIVLVSGDYQWIFNKPVTDVEFVEPEVAENTETTVAIHG